MKKVTFKNKGIDIAANMFFPKNFIEDGRYAAIICVHPGSSCKEQTAGIYARKMAEEGYITISFDASYQGESGGEPRYIEDPYMRIEDIRCAVDFLNELTYVDENRIGILGVCAGGGYAVNASMTEHRIKAVGTIVGANIGRLYREGDGSQDSAIRTLEAVGKQRTLEARGADGLEITWIPNSVEEREEAGINEIDVIEAVEYYRTNRGQCSNSPNKLRFTSVASILSFDAFHLTDQLLTQPLQIIVGSIQGGFGSFRDGHELFEKAKVSIKKDLMVVEGASHYDLYDKPEYVDKAINKLKVFYKENL